MFKNQLYFYILVMNNPKMKFKTRFLTLPNKVKDLYTEKYKTLLKEIKDLNKWKDILCSWIVSLNVVKIAIFPKVTADPMQSLSKSQWPSLAEMDKLILKFIWCCKGLRMAKIILKNKKIGRLTFPVFKTYYNVTESNQYGTSKG